MKARGTVSRKLDWARVARKRGSVVSSEGEGDGDWEEEEGGDEDLGEETRSPRRVPVLRRW